MNALSKAFLAAVVAGVACSSPAGTEGVGSSQSAIEGGQPINVDTDPVSSLLPMSTVLIETPETDAEGNVYTAPCTGVVLAPTKVLTAAHCQPNSQTEVYLYPTVANAGALPDRAHPVLVVGSPALQHGVICDPNAPNWDDCYSDVPSSHFADLAVLTLLTPIVSPHRPVILAASGSYGATQAMSKPPSAWAAGAGMINFYNWAQCDSSAATGFISNDTRHMEWVATRPLSPSDGDGSFTTRQIYTDYGDSGGPLYQAELSSAPVGADGYDLMLVGILSGSTPGCGLIGSDTYTSTAYVDNFDWLVQQGGSASPLFAEEPDAGPGVDGGFADPVAPVVAAGDDGGASGGGAVAASNDGAVGGGGPGCAVATGRTSKGGGIGALVAFALLGARRRRRRA